MPRITVHCGASNAGNEEPPARRKSAGGVPVPGDAVQLSFSSVGGYTSRSYRELLFELRSRGLPRAGSRDELIARLERADRGEAE